MYVQKVVSIFPSVTLYSKMDSFLDKQYYPVLRIRFILDIRIRINETDAAPAI